MMHDIGSTAGQIWRTLKADGEMSVAALKKSLKVKDTTVDWAIGWLAREDKIILRRERNIYKIALRPEEEE